MNRFFIVIHIAFMLISCGTGENNKEKQVLKYNSATGITSLDPAFARTQENIRAVNQLFNGLLQLDSQLLPSPAIAKHWSISEDSKTYTFILRNDVLFHNDPIFKGLERVVTAHDFEYSFNRIVDPKTASDGAWIFNGIIADNEPFVAINDTTFSIKLNKPFAPLLSMLTMAYCYVVPHEAVSAYGTSFGKHPVGTGPFQFANWADGIKLNFVKNTNYFEATEDYPIPFIDAISISFIQSKQTELLEFTQEKLDVFTGLESSFKDEILTSEGELTEKYTNRFVLQKSPFLNTEYLAFNVEDRSSPVYDLNFRKAIHHAIDRESMVLYLRNSVGIAADGGFAPRGLPFFYSADSSPYNPDLARTYLTKSTIQQVSPLILTTTPNYLDLCILVQKNCADIGIAVKVDVVPSSLLKQQKSAGELAFFRSSWIADYPDNENYMACFYGNNKAPNGPNYTRLVSEEFDKIYEELLAATTVLEKAKLNQKLESILAQDQPFTPLFYDESLWIRNEKIKGMRVNALNHLDLRYVQIVND